MDTYFSIPSVQYLKHLLVQLLWNTGNPNTCVGMLSRSAHFANDESIYFALKTACAAASLAMGILYGEQLT